MTDPTNDSLDDEDPWADPVPVGDAAGNAAAGGTGARWRRHRARRAALQAVYQWQLSGTASHELIAQFVVDGALKRADREFFDAAVEAVAQNSAELDEAVTPWLSGRSFAELDQVERALLRLACWEMKYRLDVPYRVVINEAVNLAKTFGAEDGHKFINGVLDKLASVLRAVGAGAAATASLTAVDEFDLIRAFTERLGDALHGPGVVLGPGDDCALLDVPAGHQLATSVDALVADVHFPADAAGDLVGGRALCVAASDLAAMGATPLACTLALTLPAGQQAWALDLATGMAAMAGRLALPVVGGNMASGALQVTVTVYGHVPAGQALLRSGAQVGDHVWVTGQVGLGHLGLIHGDQAPDGSAAALARYWQPLPRLALGSALRGLATAAQDTSDGLLADAGHLARASAVQLVLARDALPWPEHLSVDADIGLLLASAGDDYELLFTAPPAAAEQIQRLAGTVPVTRIGTVAAAADQPVQLVDGGGQALPLPADTGWRHFDV